MPKNEEIKKLSEAQIEMCIAVLETLNLDGKQIINLPEDKRIALMKAAGLLSRPQKNEYLARKKDAKKANKRIVHFQDKHARNTTGIISAREATIFSAPKMIAPVEKKD